MRVSAASRRAVGDCGTDRQWVLRGALGIALYVTLAALPVVLMLVADRPPGRTFLRDFSVALAFSGLSVLGLQLLISARLKLLKAPYGIDAVYHFHRQISFVALALVALHPALLIADDPATWELFNIFASPLRSRFAVAALVALVVLVGLSVLRRRMGLRYETWRRTHGVLALVMLAAAVTHVELVGYYVNTPLKRELWIAYPVVWLLALSWARLVKPALLARRPWRVDSVRAERGSAWTLALSPATSGIDFDPGQFVWLHLGTSPFAMAEHPFSISSSADQPQRIELTVKELGDFTSQVGSVPVGATAYVDGPYGQFSVDRHLADRYVFIAGGVGITPIVGMLRTLADRGDSRPLTLVYAIADLERMTFRDEIDALASALDLRVLTVLSEPPAGWGGETAPVDASLLRRVLSADDLSKAEFFICGPEPLMRLVASDLRTLGVRPKSIRYERFALV
jgi:predicted ferric reductase